jgi:hypothetical protein
MSIANGRCGARADEEPDRLPCIRYPTLRSQDFRKADGVLIRLGFFRA